MIAGFLKGEPIGMPRPALKAKLRAAAEAGNPQARLVYNLMVEQDLKAGRVPGTSGIGPKLLAAWRCPTCKAGAALATGKDDMVTCKKGHKHPARPEAWAKYVAQLRAQVSTKTAPVKAASKVKASTSRLLRPPKR